MELMRKKITDNKISINPVVNYDKSIFVLLLKSRFKSTAKRRK